MNYTIGFMDDNGEYQDLRRFYNIQITRRTVIDTVATKSASTILKVDEDGDGKYDLRYRATENSRAELVDYSFIIYTVSGVICFILLLFIVIVVRKHRQKKRR